MPKQRRRSPRTQPAGRESSTDGPAETERPMETPDDLLEVLGDEYTRSALDAIRDEPMSGAAVADATTMSKPTAFRRLNELVDLGLVAVRHRLDPDAGHHHKEYHLVVDSVSVSFGGDDLGVTVDVDRPVSERGAASPRFALND